MILEIDAGNSFIKWRLLAADKVADKVVERGQLSTTASQWPVPASWSAASAARIASVAGVEVNARLEATLGHITPAKIKFALSTQACQGLTNGYAQPERLGVDRWLAMLAAYHDCQQACCIVDCGSAITVDYVAANGEHQGGHIIPGLGLMNRSLLSNTAEIIVDQTIQDFDCSLGSHTSAAVVHGVNYLFKAFCETLQKDLQAQSSPIELYITGGDGLLLHDLMSSGHYRPDLVMDGLRLNIDL